MRLLTGSSDRDAFDDLVARVEQLRRELCLSLQLEDLAGVQGLQADMREALELLRAPPPAFQVTPQGLSPASAHWPQLAGGFGLLCL
jgi:hypothetical protein